MKILLCLSDGIGNILQALPVVTTLERAKGWDVSICLCGANYPIPACVFQRPTYTLAGIIPEGIPAAFDGVIATGKAWEALQEHHGGRLSCVEPMLLNDPSEHDLRSVEKWIRSEVDWRLDLAREQGVAEDDLCYTYDLGTQDGATYGVVIADGYNRHGRSGQMWHVKSYPRWGEVACQLHERHKALSICSIGAKEEYVCGTMDETGHPLAESLGIVRHADLVLANDTGMYHAAALLGTPCIAVFTFTSLKKCYETEFHRSCQIVARDLPCRVGCYETGRVRRCPNDYACRDIEPSEIVDRAMEVL